MMTKRDVAVCAFGIIGIAFCFYMLWRDAQFVAHQCRSAGYIGYTMGGKFEEPHCIDKNHEYVKVP